MPFVTYWGHFPTGAMHRAVVPVGRTPAYFLQTH
jgi:hypothetical protein